MRGRRASAGCVVAALLSVAPAMAERRVSAQCDETYAYTRIRTFSAQIATSWGNPFGEKNVLAGIEQTLVARGWVRVEPDKADAMVLIHGATETRKQLNVMYSGGGWRYRGMGTGTITESEFAVGTLVVDIFESGSRQLLFRGVARGELSPEPEKNYRKVKKAVAKMFKDFPPPEPPPPGRKK